MSSRQYRYFLYSRAQYEDRVAIEKQVERKFIPGKVCKNGEWKPFTQLSKTPTLIQYSDAKIIAEGYLDDIKYKPCESIGR